MAAAQCVRQLLGASIDLKSEMITIIEVVDGKRARVIENVENSSLQQGFEIELP